ncbi:MAG: hypothetical protein H0Z29_03550 [Candidatus Marinimicrobia bacterium]|nr:hypothetical protein [Candidatus Neomarinimicrobiota bacterium]
MRLRNLSICILAFTILTVNQINSQNKNIPVDKVIKTIKQLNFVIITLGILSDGLPDNVINRLAQLQTAPPRSMRIYVTQSKLIAGDIFNDFTVLVNEKQCNAIFVWPSEAMSDPFIIKNICKMSKLKKIPLIVMQEGWLENGALIYIKNTEPVEIVVNEQVRQVLNFPINESPDYIITKQTQ